MSLPLTSPPENLCLLRLSAVGDICHALPVVRTLQKVWPETRITWIIGKPEHSLVGDIAGIEFIIFDKATGLSAYRQLRQQMQGRYFDVLLHMQMSLRASLASLLIPAGIRLGFDKRRSHDFQWLFTNQRIPFRDKQHVMESFFEFIDVLGIKERVLQWDIPIPDHIRTEVAAWLPARPFVVISPCSSMSYRNWSIQGYAEVADWVAETYGMKVLLTGGPTPIEKAYGEEINARCKHKPLNLIGRTSLKQLLAILDMAEVVIAPDSGPAHMATAVNTPVIGLYATTNPDRARPYLSPELVINHYPQAIQDKFGKSVDEVPWGTRVRDSGTMERIKPGEVTEKLRRVLDAGAPDPGA